MYITNEFFRNEHFDHRLVDCIEVAILVVASVFGNILDPDFENDANLFKETFMEAMRIHKPRVTPELHVPIRHVPVYVRRTGVPPRPTSNRVFESQHKLL